MKNFWSLLIILDEISRQLSSSDPKVIFGLVENLSVIADACRLADKPSTKIVALKTEIQNLIQPGVINFVDLISIKGNFK